MNFDILQYVAITAICYLIGLGVKASALDDKWIPCIVGALGGVLGVVALFVVPDFPAGDPLNAVAIGVVSGLAATGADQIYKQLR
jgi:deoxyribose-phosphate aldolase